MNDFYSVVTVLLSHAYQLVTWTSVVLIPARMLFNAFIGRNILR